VHREIVGVHGRKRDTAKAAAVIKAIAEVAELKSKALGELRRLTSTIHVAFYARA
jgi:hypothetical protein